MVINPLVSIVIPVYNAASFIADTVTHTLQQSYKNIEIIIVDDGSNDNSYQIAKQYESPKITVVKQVNKGASAARNHGTALARGEYIQFLDADDFLHPQKIELQIETLKNYTNLHLIGGTWQRFVNTIDNIYGEVMPKINQEVAYFDKVEWLIERPMMVPHTWLVSKTLIALAGPWNEELTLNDDGEFFYRIIAASTGVVIDSKAKTYYRSFNSASLSSRNGRKAMLSWIKSIQSYKKIINQIAGDRGNDSVDQYFYLLSYWCLNEFPDLVEICKTEMYNPNSTYQIEDKIVFKLSTYIGLSKAKQIRDLLNSIKQQFFVKRLINIIKFTLGKTTY